MRSEPIISGIRDNRDRGTVGDFLRSEIIPNSDLAFVSAYFTIYAYQKLQTELDPIKKLRLLFGEPTFIKSIDPNRTETKSFQFLEQKLEIRNQLRQKKIAKDCADWITEKVEIRSIEKSNFLHGKMYHIQNGENSATILGSSNFTLNGLGFAHNSNIELNIIIDRPEDRESLKNWFDDLWRSDLVKNVKSEVLEYLAQIYRDNDPEFVYHKMLYSIFYDLLTDRDLELEKDQMHFFDTQIWNKLYNFYIQQIPIPKSIIEDPKTQQPIIDLVDEILELKKSDQNSDTSALESEIDDLVYRLYDLTADEIAVVCGG